MEAALYGTLPGYIQTTPRAEMWAVIETLRRALLPIQIHTDHVPIVEGLERGKLWTQRPERENADLWSLLWFYIEDLGGTSDDLQIIWVKGHDDGESTEAIGNRYADHFAKAGAALHELPDEVLEVGVKLRAKQVQVPKMPEGV